MKTKCFIIFIGLLILGTGSCKKGDTGPQGLQGEKGDEGEKGIQGVKGADGSVIYSGTAAPANTLGKNGDYYFRKNTGDFYGPKTTSGWGAATNLKGSDGKNGTNGANGSKILSGTAIPAVSVGAVGDFYFKTDTYHFFGPKTASGWGTAMNLRGATGTANVIYSGWLGAKNFKDSVIDNTSMKVAHLYAPRVTQDVINKAVVLVYLYFGGGTFSLPYSSYASGKASTISYLLKTNEIVITRFTHDGSNSIGLSSAIAYRYVIIPGGVVAKLKEQRVDLNKYEEVEEALKLAQ